MVIMSINKTSRYVIPWKRLHMLFLHGCIKNCFLHIFYVENRSDSNGVILLQSLIFQKPVAVPPNNMDSFEEQLSKLSDHMSIYMIHPDTHKESKEQNLLDRGSTDIVHWGICLQESVWLYLWQTCGQTVDAEMEWRPRQEETCVVACTAVGGSSLEFCDVCLVDFDRCVETNILQISTVRFQHISNLNLILERVTACWKLPVATSGQLTSHLMKTLERMMLNHLCHLCHALNCICS